MEIKWYLFLSLALFVVGIIGVLTRRNVIVFLMCIELMFSSVNLLLVAFSKMHLATRELFSGSAATGGQIFVLFIMIVSAIQVCVGLSIVVLFYRNTRSVDINFLNRLKN